MGRADSEFRLQKEYEKHKNTKLEIVKLKKEDLKNSTFRTLN